MDLLIPSKIRGVQLTGVAGVGSASTTHTPNKSDGKVIGISCGETDTLQLLSHTLLSVTQGEKTNVVTVPMNNLLPVGNRAYFPIELENEGTVTFTVQSLHASTTTAKMPVVMLHYAPKK